MRRGVAGKTPTLARIGWMDDPSSGQDIAALLAGWRQACEALVQGVSAGRGLRLARAGFKAALAP